jgi:hypothetical protein
VLLLALFYALLYTSVVSPLAITLMGLALLWRNDLARREQRAAEPTELDGPAGRRLATNGSVA